MDNLINYTVVGKLDIDTSSSDSRPVVYSSDRQAMPTARFRRAALLATADTDKIFNGIDGTMFLRVMKKCFCNLVFTYLLHVAFLISIFVYFRFTNYEF